MIARKLKNILISCQIGLLVLSSFAPVFVFAQADSEGQNVDNKTPASAGVFVNEPERENQNPSTGDMNVISDEPEQDEQAAEEPALSYAELMRSFNSWRTGVDVNGQAKSEPEKAILKDKLLKDLPELISQEQERLGQTEIPRGQRNAYLGALEKYLRQVKGEETILEKVKEFFGNLFSFGPETPPSPRPEVKIPDNPGGFEFLDEEVQIKTLPDALAMPQRFSALSAAPSPLSGQISDLPILADVSQDNGEIVINDAIRDLAEELGNNPVQIFNFVRNNIVYEPYYAAKKGSSGCLQERVCNDVDAASLTIALLRSAGIPARYKKSLIIVSVSNLKSMLGSEETKTIYGALAQNGVPVFLTSGQYLGGDFENYDFSGVSHLILEWVLPEAYYEYDERAGNFSNILDLSAFETNEELQTLLSAFPKKQWLSIEPLIRPYQRTSNEIVHDSANFNTENYWYDYLRYSGSLSPIDKYASDLQSQTSKSIADSQYQSGKNLITQEFDILPPSQPYLFANSDEIQGEHWSALPDARRRQVKIELLDGQTPVLSHTFWGGEINNLDLNLFYEGATPADQAIIEDYGGLHLTPAPLVNIKAVLESQNQRFAESQALQIGRNLVLRFTMSRNQEQIHVSEKFSIAGNNEGIVISLSKTMPDLLADTPSKILLKGNVGLARQYLVNIEEAGNLLSASLDHPVIQHFTRAVVTQNRVLNMVDGLPTTFDFKGLSLDASTLTNDYSNRGNYNSHNKDFRLLFSLNASFQEAQIFTDIAGLDGISTVRGLQYAYSRPQDYTVHKITSNNEALIDTLSLSENTKSNMHTDVQAGNTIITPDKAVTSGNWTGIFYISLAPNWTGTYAIGEQTQQNGGYTTSQLLQIVYINQTDSQRRGFLRQFGNNERFYQEDRISDQVLCRIGSVEYDLVTNSADWRSSYGFACNIGSVQFGDIDHAYIHASNASKFTSPGRYDYWEYLNNVQTKINNYISAKKNLPSSHINYLESGQKFNFRFSTVLGAYLQSICENKSGLSGLFGRCGDEATIYYAPNQSGGDIYRARSDILSKLSKDDNKVVKILGWPTSDEAGAAPSQKIGEGQYQNFVNGQIYKYKSWGLTWVYYTHGKLTQEHNNQDGTRGPLGFPQRDPQENANYAYQLFEGDKELGWNKISGSTSVENHIKYRCQVNGDLEDRWYGGASLFLATMHGLLDTIKFTIKDSFELLKAVQLPWLSSINALINYEDTLGDISELAVEIKQVNIKKLTLDLKNIGSAIAADLVEQWETSYGVRGCQARQQYLEGRIIGEAALFYVGAAKAAKVGEANKIKALTTVRILKRVELLFPKLKLVEKVGYYGRKFRLINADDVTELNRVRAITDSNQKGREGRNFVNNLLGDNKFLSEREIPDEIPNLGKRRVDLWDPVNNIAYEVKTTKDKVSYTGDIVGQLGKDTYLMNLHNGKYRPVWIFTESGPTQTLINEMSERSIDFIVIN